MTAPCDMGPVQWFGGKGLLAHKLLPLVPYLRIYCEPYAGGGALFWRRHPSPVEIYNDLNGDLINLMRVLQDEDKAKKLHARLAHTLYSRAEWKKAYQDDSEDEIEKAWGFYVKFAQSFSGRGTSWAFNLELSCRQMAACVSGWWSRFDRLPAWHRRIARAQIECADGIECIQRWDTPNTVFYIDPPYVHDTRAQERYMHEMDNEKHHALVQTLLSCQGAVVLSGYDHPIYHPLDKAGWERIEFDVVCHAAGKTRATNLQGKGAALKYQPRIEVVWRNHHPANRQQLDLFHDPRP